MNGLLTRHGAGERLGRHRHASAYAALVLEGGYIEAGDRGRFAVTAGQVVLHGPYESHQDAFFARGARVLNLPVHCEGRSLARIADPDAIARLAERDLQAACDLLRASLIEDAADLGDWPDRLGQSLIADPDVDLGEWAAQHGLAPQSLSRGFRKAFGVTPKRFRAEQRVLCAVRALPGWRGTGAALAAELGFADQAHMTRSIGNLTGRSPSQIRVK